MIHQLKITSYAFIVALVPLLLLPHLASAVPHPQAPQAVSCKGWACGGGASVFPGMPVKEGSICYQGSPGASDASYVCHNKKWTEFEPTLCIHVPDGPELITCMYKARNYMRPCMKHYSAKWKKSDLCTDTSIECLSEDVKSKAFQLAIGLFSGKWFSTAQAQCHRDWRQLIKDLNQSNPYAKGCNPSHYSKSTLRRKGPARACYDTL